jgi:hypothetical protein
MIEIVGELSLGVEGVGLTGVCGLSSAGFEVLTGAVIVKLF